MKKTIVLLAVAGLVLALAPAAQAASLTSSTFTSVSLDSSNVDIDATGANVVDWGYYANSDTGRDDFATNPAFDNSKAASGIGAVNAVPGVVADATGSNSIKLTGATNGDLWPRFTMTFDDGTSTGTGTAVAIGAAFGGWAGDEDNGATITFNDLGVGTHTVSLYVGHTSASPYRIFDMDYAVSASDGDLTGNSISNSISSAYLNATYEIVFSTTDADADLELQFNSTSGTGGSGWIGGYVVETVAAATPGTLIYGK